MVEKTLRFTHKACLIRDALLQNKCLLKDFNQLFMVLDLFGKVSALFDNWFVLG